MTCPSDFLSPTQAERFYDRFGRRLNSQTFYEKPSSRRPCGAAPTRDLPLGRGVRFGTGRFAEELFETYLSQQAIYVGRDISNEMVRLATERLARYQPRATVEKSDGGAQMDSPNGAFDRFISTFVLDLLPDAEAQAVVGEAHVSWHQAASPAWSV